MRLHLQFLYSILWMCLPMPTSRSPLSLQKQRLCGVSLNFSCLQTQQSSKCIPPLIHCFGLNLYIYIIREEGSIFAPQRIPFCMALGVAACTLGKVQVSTVFMCVCSTFRPSDFFYYSSKTNSSWGCVAKVTASH